jgi:hypothetical protein
MVVAFLEIPRRNTRAMAGSGTTKLESIGTVGLGERGGFGFFSITG